MSEDNPIVKIGPLTSIFKDPKLVQENIRVFRKSCLEILDPAIDISIIRGKKFIRKSGWNILNQYWDVQTIPIKSWRTELENGEYMQTVVIQTSSKGFIGPARSASCSSIEMKEKHGGESYLGMESHCYGMAETRAVGRASAAFYMIGDASAEEVEYAPSNFEATKNNNEPTEKQLAFMKNLGYDGPKPASKQEASDIIENIKNGATVAEPATTTDNDDPKVDPERYCTCEKFIRNSITKGRTCQTCLKLAPQEFE